MSDDDLQTALAKVPLLLSEAAIFLRATYWDVGYEAAAILSMTESTNAPKKGQLTVHEIVKGFEDFSSRRSSLCCWGDRAGACFTNLEDRFGLWPSRWGSGYILECLSVAFLHSHRERLVWSINQNAGNSFLYVVRIPSVCWLNLIHKIGLMVFYMLTILYLF